MLQYFVLYRVATSERGQNEKNILIRCLAASQWSYADSMVVLRFSGSMKVGKEQSVPLCLTLFEHFIMSRGLTGYSGYLQYAQSTFTVIGNTVRSEVKSIPSEEAVVLAAIDQNNFSAPTSNLLFGALETEISGTRWDGLVVKQEGKAYRLSLKKLRAGELCSP